MVDQVHVQDTLFRLTGVGVVQTDMKTGRFVRANRTFCEMVGYSEAELRGMTYLELIHPDDRARDAASFASLQHGEQEGGTSLTRVLHKNGSVVWLELHITVIGEGSEALSIAVVNDVTERERTKEAADRAEAELRESEEKYRTLFESVDEGFCVTEVLFEGDEPVDYRFLEVNPAFEQQTGLKDATGKWIRELTPQHEAHWFDLHGEVALSGEPRRFEQHAKQLGRWFDGYAFRVGKPQDRKVAILFNDITERKRAGGALQDLNETLEQRIEERTEQLRHSEQRFSQAFYANPIPACMTTLGKEVFVEVNDAFLELTGYERDEVVGRTSRELGMWSSPEDHKKIGEVQQSGRGFRDMELGLRDKEGGVHTVLMSAEIIQLDSEQGYLKMFYDITERKRTEEQLMQAIQGVMGDAAWFSQRIVEKMANMRVGQQSPVQLAELSRREREVLERLARGASNEQIGEELGIATQTVRNYITTLYDKLDVHSRAEAIIWARERGIS